MLDYSLQQCIEICYYHLPTLCLRHREVKKLAQYNTDNKRQWDDSNLDIIVQYVLGGM